MVDKGRQKMKGEQMLKALKNMRLLEIQQKKMKSEQLRNQANNAKNNFATIMPNVKNNKMPKPQPRPVLPRVGRMAQPPRGVGVVG